MLTAIESISKITHGTIDAVKALLGSMVNRTGYTILEWSDHVLRGHDRPTKLEHIGQLVGDWFYCAGLKLRGEHGAYLGEIGDA